MTLSIKTKLWISIVLFGFSNIAIDAQTIEKRYRITGKISDGRTKKGIKKIPFIVLPYNRTIEADSKGAFLFNMPAGNQTFVIDYYPFDKKEVTLDLQSDTTLLIELHTPFGSQYIEEVDVIASHPVTEQPASLEQLDNHTLRVLPPMLGERDVLKAFGLTAGVTSSSEGAADMQVRGGEHGQNLYLLDGIPLYSTQHFFGMVSAYNPIIVKSAKLYKSGFSAEYGGKVSSIVNVLTEDANLNKTSVAVEINLLSSKAALNIPLVKDKLALAVSGRISNYSLINFMSLYQGDGMDTNLSLHFADVNANLVWKITDKDKLKLTGFSNSDGIDVTQSDIGWVNTTWIDNSQQNLGLNWYRTISDRSDNHLLAYVDRYGFDFGGSNVENTTNSKQINQILSGINSAGLVDKYTFKISDRLNLTAGGSLKMYGFSPVQVQQTDTTTTRIQYANLIKQTEGVVFAETEYQFADKQQLTTGLRVSTMGNSEKTFTYLEPRIGYHGIFTNQFSISASISRMTQPVHRLANPGLGIPFEMFLPSSVGLTPETSWNYSLGVAKDYTFAKSRFSVKADAWYKSMQNIVEFKDGYDALTSMLYKTGVTEGANSIVTQGNGKAYGIDFTAEFSKNNWSLTADYTLMQAVNQFADLNYGRPFAASTDMRHSISLTGEIKLSPTWILSATWQYRSGRPITVPTRIFFIPIVNPITGEIDNSNQSFQAAETERNNYRTKAFHKLDFSFTHNYKAFKRYDASISLGVYNAYNQTNPFVYFISTEYKADGSYKPVLKTISLFPILPSFTWSLKF